MGAKHETKDLSVHSQLVSFRKPDTPKNLNGHTWEPPCAPFNKLIINKSVHKKACNHSWQRFSI